MMRLLKNRIMSLLSITLLLTTMPSNTLAPFQTMHIAEKSVDSKETINLHNSGLLKIQQMYEEQKEQKELKTKELVKELSKNGKVEVETKSNEPEWQEFILTFYTALESENSKAGAITCRGRKLSRGMIASNVYKLDTQIYLEEYGIRTVADRGGNNFNTSNRLDVFVARNYGESDAAYKKRAESYGVKHVKGYIVK